MDHDVFETVKVKFTMMGRSGSEQVFNTAMRENVTPPEYMILEEIHGRHNVTVMDITGIATEHAGFVQKGRKQEERFRPRTHEEEIDRLRSWYGEKIFSAVFPERYPRLPFSFNEARIHTSIPDNVRDISAGKTQASQTAQISKALSSGSEGAGSQKQPSSKGNKENKEVSGAKGD